MANSVGNKFDVEMRVHPALVQAFTKAEIEKQFVKPLYLAIANYIVGRGGGLTPMASPIGRHFTKTNKDRYNFAPLSPKYARWKRRKVGNKPILVLSGAWKKAAVYGSRIKSRGKKGYSIQAHKAPHYAEYLEEGTAKMPARPAFTLNNEDRDVVLKHAKEVAKDLAGDLIDISQGASVKVV